MYGHEESEREPRSSWGGGVFIFAGLLGWAALVLAGLIAGGSYIRLLIPQLQFGG